MSLKLATAVLLMLLVGEQNYRQYTGQHKRFCGTVVEVAQPFKNCEAAFLIGGHADDWKIAAIVPPERRTMLPKSADAYLFNEICVTGLVTERDRKPVVEVVSASQLEVLASPSEVFGAGAVRACEEGVVAARPRQQPRPVYTRRAMQDKARGLVVTQGVVGKNGKVLDARVIRSLHPDLDVAALDTLRRWTFEPATKAGVPVTSLVEVEFKFTLR